MTYLEMEKNCIDILLAYQEQNHLSQKELAQKLELSENTLGRMLAGKTHVLGDALLLMHNLNKMTGKMAFELAGTDVAYSQRLRIIQKINSLPEEYLESIEKTIFAIQRDDQDSLNFSPSTIQEAMDLLQSQYIKILKVNLTQDSYEVAIVRPDEWEERKSITSNSKISSWFHDFAESDYMNPDDYEDFTIFTNLKNLRTHIRHTPNLRFKYRRKVNQSYQDVVMDIIRADQPDTTDQIVMLYIRVAETLYE
ncbi:MAG: hypothetical protein KBT01_06015 [Clostridiales bacterium]|nr:hypothetical protein [Candidatus Blautia equi]